MQWKIFLTASVKIEKTMQGFKRWCLCCIVIQWLSSSPKNLAWPHPYLIHVMEICIIHHWSNKTEGYKSMSYLSSLPSVSSSTRNKYVILSYYAKKAILKCLKTYACQICQLLQTLKISKLYLINIQPRYCRWKVLIS